MGALSLSQGQLCYIVVLGVMWASVALRAFLNPAFCRAVSPISTLPNRSRDFIKPDRISEETLPECSSRTKPKCFCTPGH